MINRNTEIVRTGFGFDAVVSTATGKLHLSHVSNPSAIRCNSRNGGIRSARFASSGTVAHASLPWFCSKCFNDALIAKARAAAEEIIKKARA